MSQQGGGPLSWADVFCASCLDDLLRRGWGPKHLPRLRSEVTCDACAEVLQARGDERGWPLEIEAWLTCPEGLSQPAKAMHEAAHAVVAEHGGLLVTEVHLRESDLDIAGYATKSGGHFTAMTPEGGVPMQVFAEAMHAGAAGTRLWLADHGFAGDLAAQVAAAYAGAGDMQVMAEHFDDPQMHEQALANADALVREHRREIDEVATELVRLSEQGKDMGREALHIAMDRAQRSSKNRAQNNRPSTQHDPGVPAEPKSGDSGRPQPARPLAGAGASTTSSAGGTGMAGIEEIVIAVAQTTEDSERMRAALMEVQQLAEQTTGRLGTVLADSSQPEVHEGLSAFGQIAQQVVDLVQLAAGAADGLQSYRNRL